MVYFLLFPISYNETTARFAILALVLTQSGFYSWLALAIIAHSKKHKLLNEKDETPKVEVQAEATPEPTLIDKPTTPEPTLIDEPTTPKSTPNDSQPAPEA